MDNHSVNEEQNLASQRDGSKATSELSADRRPNYWTEEEAQGDTELPRCIHAVPRNVYCGKCEG